MIKKCFTGFVTSAFCGMIVLLIIELAVRLIGGVDFSPLTPEFVALFPSETIAMEVDVLLYGLFGLAFSGMGFIYERDKLGFVIQNIIYFLGTGIVWIPITIFMWRLDKYPPALISTICGFTATYIIMTIVGYRTTKRDLSQINEVLVSNS